MSEGTTTMVASPCTGICTIDELAGWCAGCRRTRDEIAMWRMLDNDGKREVLARVELRGFDDPVAGCA